MGVAAKRCPSGQMAYTPYSSYARKFGQPVPCTETSSPPRLSCAACDTRAQAKLAARAVLKNIGRQEPADMSFTKGFLVRLTCLHCSCVGAGTRAFQLSTAVFDGDRAVRLGH